MNHAIYSLFHKADAQASACREGEPEGPHYTLVTSGLS